MITRTSLADIAGIAHVRRWHAINVHREQTLAEHTILVTFYAHDLLQRIKPDYTAEEAMALILDSMWHDVPEALVGGDVPTPLKRYMESKFPDGESPLDQLEREVCPEHHKYRSAIADTFLYSISKLADILEAQHFSMIEVKAPKHDEIFEGRGRTYRDLVEVSRKRWPDLNWDGAYDAQKELLYGKSLRIPFKEKFQETEA